MLCQVSKIEGLFLIFPESEENDNEKHQRGGNAGCNSGNKNMKGGKSTEGVTGSILSKRTKQI